MSADTRREVFKIELCEIPKAFGTNDRWQADCGDCHARGSSPEEAISRLVVYTRAYREWQLGRSTHPGGQKG